MRFFIAVCLALSAAVSAGAEADVEDVKAKPSDQRPARIAVSLWDVGGGNLFNPNAKITVDVHGAQAFNATLSSVSREGVRTELQTLPCRDGRVSSSAQNTTGSTQALRSVYSMPMAMCWLR